MNIYLFCNVIRQYLLIFVFQQSRMEERLDDAIHVLRNHAESREDLLPPGAAAHMMQQQQMMQPHPASHSNGPPGLYPPPPPMHPMHQHPHMVSTSLLTFIFQNNS